VVASSAAVGIATTPNGLHQPASDADVIVDPMQAARAAGLRYTPDGGPGITRRRAGRGWSFRGPDGAVVRDAETLQRIRSLAIPPAWTDVWINPHPRGHIQATGRDARGRKQYRYHPRWREVRDETKFGRMIAFAEALPALRQRVEADLERPGLPREKTLATVVRLLERSLIRVGNAEYARNNDSYGLTTLRDDHVEFSGATVRFVFRGKSGKEHEIDVRDRRIARLVKKMQDLPGQPLFQYLDDDRLPQTIDSEDVNLYLREIAGEAFTAKDFRTWSGTVLAARALRDLGPAETKTATTANIVAAIDQVAARLGNTRAVCRSSYIHPSVLAGYETSALLTFTCELTEETGLDPDEQWTLAFLRQEAAPGGRG
jgi:DNA topoisomerase I